MAAMMAGEQIKDMDQGTIQIATPKNKPIVV